VGWRVGGCCAVREECYAANLLKKIASMPWTAALPASTAHCVQCVLSLARENEAYKDDFPRF
jgi:hypothetical protein